MPAPVVDPDGVEGAHFSAGGVGLLDTGEQRLLEWRRHAHAADTKPFRKAHEILEVRGFEWHVHGILSTGREAGIVHRWRDRMRERGPEHAVHVAGRGHLSEPELAQHPCRADLSWRNALARIRPARPESRGQETCRQARGAHRDEHGRRVCRRSGPDVEQRKPVAQTRGRHGQLDHLRAGATHRSEAIPQVGRQAFKVVHRQHDVPAPTLLHQIIEAAAPLDVDVLGTQIQRLGQQRAPLFLRSPEPPALPDRTTRHDHGAAAVDEGPGHVRVLHRVQSQLHQVGFDRSVTARA